MKQYDFEQSDKELEEYMKALVNRSRADRSGGSSSLKKSSDTENQRRVSKRAPVKPYVQKQQNRVLPVGEQRIAHAEELKAAKRLEHEKTARTHCLSIACAAMIFTLVFLLLLSVCIKDKTYSAQENRTLAQRPPFSFSALADGSYMKNMETYLSDQIVGRDAFIKAKTAVDVFFGKREENNVYIGKNHFLIEKPTAYDEKNMKEIYTCINSVTKNAGKAKSYIMIAPNASYVLEDKLPFGAENTDQKQQIQKIYSSLNGVKGVDALGALMQYDNKEELYYRTDHHWTTAAAEISFRALAKAMDLDTSKTKFTTYAVTDSFEGTLASSSGVHSAQDVIYITYPASEKYVVEYVSEKVKKPSVFDESKLNEKNKYEVFFGGNFAQIDIETSHVESSKKLLVIKDSYANALLPMLIPYFKEIVIVDPRYYIGDVNELIKNEAFSDILWLYNCSTFLGDTSISKVCG